MRRRRRFKVATTLAATVGTSMVSPPLSAFDRRDVGVGISCSGLALQHNLRWRFVDGGAVWTEYEKNVVREAIASWGYLRNSAGSKVLNPLESSTGNVEVRRELSNGTNSHVSCSGGVPSIRLHSPTATPQAPGSLANASSHEAGHAHGLDHVGGGETLMYGGVEVGGGVVAVGRVPRMAGCATGLSSGYPESDDWAQVVAKGGGANLPTGAFNPDAGFETFGLANALGSSPRADSLKMWAGQASIVSDNGNDYARVTSTGLTQLVRVNTPPSGFYFGARYKMDSSSIGGNFKLQYRRLGYPAGVPGCGNAWPSAFDVNSPSFVLNSGSGSGATWVWVTAGNQSVAGTTSFVNSPLWAASPAANQPFGNGLDVRLLAANLNAASGAFYVDNFSGVMS